MNRRSWLKSMLLSVIFSRSMVGQSTRIYAKFGSNGETVGLYNLNRSAELCGTWQVIEGTVTSLSVEKRERYSEYRFGLYYGAGVRSFQFMVGRDDVSENDIRDLLTRKRGVKVRACRTGRLWFAEEITRQR